MTLGWEFFLKLSHVVKKMDYDNYPDPTYCISFDLISPDVGDLMMFEHGNKSC